MMVEARYDRVQVILHWLIAVMILAMIGLGLFMVELPKKHELPPGEESVRAFYFLLHKSLGITAAILIAVRLGWRLMHKAPSLPDSISKWQQRAAGAVHGLLYAFMIAMPVSGYMQSMYSKYDTKFWGLVMPRIADADKVMRENMSDIHEYLSFIFIGLIVLHVAALIKHKLAGVSLMERMSLK